MDLLRQLPFAFLILISGDRISLCIYPIYRKMTTSSLSSFSGFAYLVPIDTKVKMQWLILTSQVHVCAHCYHVLSTLMLIIPCTDANVCNANVNSQRKWHCQCLISLSAEWENMQIWAINIWNKVTKCAKRWLWK